MLELVPPEPSHQEPVHESLLAAVRSSNIIDELDLTVLVDHVDLGDSPRTTKTTVVGKLDFRGVFPFCGAVFDEVLNLGTEYVEYEPTVWFEVLMNRF
jgi:hypothetical protein